MDDLGCILFVLGFTRESKGVLALAIGNLVDPVSDGQQVLLQPVERTIPEPLVGGPDETGKVTLDVLNVVELGSEGVLNVDDDDFPVCLALVEQGHDAKDLDLFHLTGVTDLLADFTDVERVVVTFGLGLCMQHVRVLPGL